MSRPVIGLTLDSEEPGGYSAMPWYALRENYSRAVARADALTGMAVNVGMNQEISIGDLAALVARLLGVSPRIVSTAERERPAASEVERLVCDNALLLKSTDWRPAHTLESGLRETIAWYESNERWWRPLKVAGGYRTYYKAQYKSR